MRIAYIAPYQGPCLLRARPVVRNLSLAGSVKIELIAELLASLSHQIEIISQGEVIERKCKWYPRLSETERFHSDIPVYYASAFPVRFLNGVWSSRSTLEIFKTRHKQSPFDLVIIYNLKFPQIVCADYALRRLGLPVVFEYEDDAFVDLTGKHVLNANGPFGPDVSTLVSKVAGCIAVSPHLLSQMTATIPNLLLRGAIGHDLLQTSERMKNEKYNWVLFSGTHYRSKGIRQLIQAWREFNPLGWELHITGYGELTNTLQKIVKDDSSIVFHGLVSRQELIRIMCSARVCINPHDISHTPGNVFAFKIIEYLAAGAHVISTPMGVLEEELETGMTYIPGNEPATILEGLKQVIVGSTWKRTARQHVLDRYGPESISKKLDMLLQQASVYHRLKGRRGCG